jgi:hypothetical protein
MLESLVLPVFVFVAVRTSTYGAATNVDGTGGQSTN